MCCHKALQDHTIADKADELWLASFELNRLELMMAFEAAPPERYPQIREALLLLLPQVRKLSAPDTSKPGGKFTLGTEVVEVRDGRERLLIRFGAVLHALAPDAYTQSKDLFGQWDSALASVKTVPEAARWPGSSGNIPPPPAPTRAAPPAFGDALALWEKMAPGEAKARGAARLITRNDAPVDQRATDSGRIGGGARRRSRVESSGRRGERRLDRSRRCQAGVG
jgi:hypothetical protein